MLADPKLIAPGSGKDGFDSAGGYKLRDGSPASAPESRSTTTAAATSGETRCPRERIPLSELTSVGAERIAPILGDRGPATSP